MAKRASALGAPFVQPPNGERVTMRDLKSALYDLDVGLGKRFTAIQDSINGLGERLTLHEQEHLAGEQEEVKKLDAKKAGILTAIVTVVGGIATGVFEAVRRVN